MCTLHRCMMIDSPCSRISLAERAFSPHSHLPTLSHCFLQKKNVVGPGEKEGQTWNALGKRNRISFLRSANVHVECGNGTVSVFERKASKDLLPDREPLVIPGRLIRGDVRVEGRDTLTIHRPPQMQGRTGTAFRKAQVTRASCFFVLKGGDVALSCLRARIQVFRLENSVGSKRSNRLQLEARVVPIILGKKYVAHHDLKTTAKPYRLLH
jgi:hypothetical protein